jgi:hypothetical protein
MSWICDWVCGGEGGSGGGVGGSHPLDDGADDGGGEAGGAEVGLGQPPHDGERHPLRTQPLRRRLQLAGKAAAGGGPEQPDGLCEEGQQLPLRLGEGGIGRRRRGGRRRLGGRLRQGVHHRVIHQRGRAVGSVELVLQLARKAGVFFLLLQALLLFLQLAHNASILLLLLKAPPLLRLRSHLLLLQGGLPLLL